MGKSDRVRCQGCSVDVAPNDVRLDAEARELCRKCHALALVGEANAVEQGQGMLRRCRRCDGLTLRAGAPIEGEVESYGPGQGDSAPMAVAHSFRCAYCRKTMTLLTPMGIVGAALVAFLLGGSLHDVRGDWQGPVLGASLFAVVLVREVVLRTLHPAK